MWENVQNNLESDWNWELFMGSKGQIFEGGCSDLNHNLIRSISWSDWSFFFPAAVDAFGERRNPSAAPQRRPHVMMARGRSGNLFFFLVFWFPLWRHWILGDCHKTKEKVHASYQWDRKSWRTTSVKNETQNIFTVFEFKKRRRKSRTGQFVGPTRLANSAAKKR